MITKLSVCFYMYVYTSMVDLSTFTVTMVIEPLNIIESYK